MNFETLIPIVSKYAPLLGASLGGPAGGVIGSLISVAFGGNSKQPDDLMRRITSDPEAELKLRDLEYKHQESLLQINSKDYVTEVDDRKNARDMEAKNSDFFKYHIIGMSWILMIGFFITIYFMFCAAVNVNETEKQLLAMLFGVLSSKFSTVIDYFYGSSHISKGS